jgi:orotidine-5'-phosphate decarboxylase
VLPTVVLRSTASPPVAAIARAFRRFGDAVLDALGDIAAAVKPQVAFYEVCHADGLAAYIEGCREARRRGIPVIADIKRGDIGTTAAAYAEAWLAPVDGRPPVADAVTVNPYMGRDTLDPFLKVGVPHGGGIFAPCSRLRIRRRITRIALVNGHSLHEHVATDLAAWFGRRLRSRRRGRRSHPIPDELRRLRNLLTRSWILVPGQRKAAPPPTGVLAMDGNGHGALVNASRSLTFPWGADKPAPEGWKTLIREAGVRMRDDLRRAATPLLSSPGMVEAGLRCGTRWSTPSATTPPRCSRSHGRSNLNYAQDVASSISHAGEGATRAHFPRKASTSGCDQSRTLLREAQRRGGGPTFVVADQRALPFASATFDACHLFFTLFGYGDGPEHDVRILRRPRASSDRAVASSLIYPTAIGARRACRMAVERRRRRDRIFPEVDGVDAWRRT